MLPDLTGLAGRPVIVGAGLAGVSAALALAPRPVVLVTKAPLGEGCSSVWSQAGLAAAVGSDDTPGTHAADTVAAGDGLCDEAVVRRIVAAGPAAVEFLEEWGVRFGRDPSGAFVLKLEAAHTRRRVVNAGGDRAGREIMRALVDAVRRTPSITVLEGVTALDLVVGDGVEGVVLAAGRKAAVLPTRAVVMATGGLGGLWQHTTNPLGNSGQGVALAARAGAALADLEFVQFHPTALDVGLDPMPLATESLRGDGATLIDEHGVRFMAGQGRAELSPRDVVARAIWFQLTAGRRVFLDTRDAIGAELPDRFPQVVAACRAAGIDPLRQPIPIRPAAHYHMGGIAVDARGRTTLDGLWACGEAAASGLHGANRLASNSLLEAVVTGRDVAADLAGLHLDRVAARSHPTPIVPLDDLAGLARVRAAMSAGVGVLRDRDGLERALAMLLPIAYGKTAAASSAVAGLLVAAAALRRAESRGGHCRTDYPDRVDAFARRWPIGLDEAFAMAEAAIEPMLFAGAVA